MIRNLFVLSIAVLSLSACQTAAQHQQQLPSAQEEKMTVGTVQREIREGMSAAEVLKVLGSPNVVTKNGKNGETWVYDKFSTETAYSQSSGGVGVLVIAGARHVGGGAGGQYSANAGAASRSQRTLTVILDFVNGTLKSFDYHASRF